MAGKCGKFEQNAVWIKIFVEYFFEISVVLFKVYLNAVREVAAERARSKRFSHLAGATKQEWFAGWAVFPEEEKVVDDSFHDFTPFWSKMQIVVSCFWLKMQIYDGCFWLKMQLLLIFDCAFSPFGPGSPRRTSPRDDDAVGVLRRMLAFVINYVLIKL